MQRKELLQDTVTPSVANLELKLKERARTALLREAVNRHMVAPVKLQRSKAQVG